MVLRCTLQCDPGVVCGNPAVSYHRFDPPNEFQGSIMHACIQCEREGWWFDPAPVRLSPEEALVYEILHA